VVCAGGGRGCKNPDCESGNWDT